METLSEKFEVAEDGVTLTVKIYFDPDPINPVKDYDQVGRMVTWHRHYDLGHEQPKSMGIWLRGMLDEYGLNDFDSVPGIGDLYPLNENFTFEDAYQDFIYDLENDGKDQIDLAFKVLEDHIVCLPLYLYDHSGLSISCGKFSCSWDSGLLGFIWADRKKAAEEFGGEDKVITGLTSEVESYDDYLTGNCFGYVIEDENGNEIEDGSCWGFLGDKKYCIDEAKAEAMAEIKSRLKDKEALRNNIWVNA